jgi:hypothetical protein
MPKRWPVKNETKVQASDKFAHGRLYSKHAHATNRPLYGFIGKKKIQVIHVAQTKIVDKITKIERLCKYSDVPKDEEGWVWDLTYRPIPFDLLYLKIKDGIKDKAGWWDGEHWKGLRVKSHDKITAWKRQLYDYALG